MILYSELLLTMVYRVIMLITYIFVALHRKRCAFFLQLIVYCYVWIDYTQKRHIFAVVQS